MARKHIDPEKKKKTVTVRIELELLQEFEKREIENKSKFIQWVLEQYFNEDKK